MDIRINQILKQINKRLKFPKISPNIEKSKKLISEYMSLLETYSNFGMKLNDLIRITDKRKSVLTNSQKAFYLEEEKISSSSRHASKGPSLVLNLFLFKITINFFRIMKVHLFSN